MNDAYLIKVNAIYAALYGKIIVVDFGGGAPVAAHFPHIAIFFGCGGKAQQLYGERYSAVCVFSVCPKSIKAL